MKRASVAEFKAHVAAMFEQVIAGEPLQVTRRGRVIVEIWPPGVPVTERITYSILTDPRNKQAIDAEIAKRPADETSPAPAPVTQPKPPASASAPGLTLAEILKAAG